MTSRYALYDTGKLRDRFHFIMGLPRGVKPHYNVAPTSLSPVILKRDGQPIVERMIWGLVNQGAKDLNSVFRYKTYNVTSEKVLWTHSRETAVRSRRCLVPVNGYFEIITQPSSTRAFYIERKDKTMFALAGIYGQWADASGETHSTFSIITSRNNDAGYDFDRAPNILSPDDEPRWINDIITDTNSILEMLKPFPADQLIITEVNPSIATSKLNDVSLLSEWRK